MIKNALKKYAATIVAVFFVGVTFVVPAFATAGGGSSSSSSQTQTSIPYECTFVFPGEHQVWLGDVTWSFDWVSDLEVWWSTEEDIPTSSTYSVVYTVNGDDLEYLGPDNGYIGLVHPDDEVVKVRLCYSAPPAPTTTEATTSTTELPTTSSSTTVPVTRYLECGGVWVERFQTTASVGDATFWFDWLDKSVLWTTDGVSVPDNALVIVWNGDGPQSWTYGSSGSHIDDHSLIGLEACYDSTPSSTTTTSTSTSTTTSTVPEDIPLNPPSDLVCPTDGILWQNPYSWTDKSRSGFHAQGLKHGGITVPEGEWSLTYLSYDGYEGRHIWSGVKAQLQEQWFLQFSDGQATGNTADVPDPSDRDSAEVVGSFGDLVFGQDASFDILHVRRSGAGDSVIPWQVCFTPVEQPPGTTTTTSTTTSTMPPEETTITSTTEPPVVTTSSTTTTTTEPPVTVTTEPPAEKPRPEGDIAPFLDDIKDMKTMLIYLGIGFLFIGALTSVNTLMGFRRSRSRS